MRQHAAWAWAIGLINLGAAACSSDPQIDVAIVGSTGGSSGGRTNTVTGGSPTVASGGSGVVIPPGGGTGSGTGGAPPMTDVKVIISADNAYGFGYGSGNELLSYFGGVENVVAADIFACPIGNGPETYTVPAAQANSGNFLYIIGYADKVTTQGVIAKFFREGGEPVFTGMGNWQGCATGQDFDPGSGGPSLQVINRQIAACNAGNTDPATTSGGWVTTAASPRGRVVFGEDNSTERDRPSVGNEFKIVCEVDAAARWMWFDWQANRTMGSPFMWPGGNGNPTKDFLIFRLGAEAIPQPPPK